MKVSDLFKRKDPDAAWREYVGKLDVTFRAVGWAPDDARRCAERDAKLGLWRCAFRGWGTSAQEPAEPRPAKEPEPMLF